MSDTATITSKNQVHIPKHIRQKINLKTPTKVTLKAENGKIIIEPLADNPIKSLAGKYSNLNRQIDIDNIRDLVDYSDL